MVRSKALRSTNRFPGKEKPQRSKTSRPDRRGQNSERRDPSRDSLMISKLSLPVPFKDRHQEAPARSVRFAHLRTKREDANISSAALHKLCGLHDVFPVKQS